MGDAALCYRLRASGSALELEAAEAIGKLVAHMALLEFKGANGRETCKQLEAENARLREVLERITTCADWPRGNDVHGIAQVARDALRPFTEPQP